jgi:Spy/CpxP family protein refolding chaperone
MMMQRGPGGPFGGENPLMLLRSEQVLKELEIVDEQKEKLRKLGEEVRDEMQKTFSGFRDLSREERDKKLAEMQGQLRARSEELNKKVEGILLPHQLDRLKQIQLQLRGAQALGDPNIIKALGITDEQKEKLNEIRDQVEQKSRGMRDKFQGLRDLDENARQEKMQELRGEFEKLRNEGTERAMSVLSAEQKATLEKMRGEKFDLDRSQLFGGQRRDRGPRPEGAPREGRRRPNE